MVLTRQNKKYQKFEDVGYFEAEIGLLHLEVPTVLYRELAKLPPSIEVLYFECVY